MDKKNKGSREVTILIPFTYTLGEEAPASGKVLNTIEDCKDEVLYELINSDVYLTDPWMEVKED